MVPGAEAIVDALATVSNKRGELAEIRFDSHWGYDDNKPTRIERQESLATEWMMLEVIDLARHIELATIHQADDGSCLLTTELDIGKRMVTIGHALVDRKRIVPFEFDNVAEGRKPRTGQGLYRERIRHRSCRVF